MKIENEKMGTWELQKAGYLLQAAGDLGMDLSGYGMLDVNPNSGYTYLWLEDMPYTLYMPITCKLTKSDVMASWSCGNCGAEFETELKNKNTNALEKWVNGLRCGEGDQYCENCVKEK